MFQVCVLSSLLLQREMVFGTRDFLLIGSPRVSFLHSKLLFSTNSPTFISLLLLICLGLQIAQVSDEIVGLQVQQAQLEIRLQSLQTDAIESVPESSADNDNLLTGSATPPAATDDHLLDMTPRMSPSVPVKSSTPDSSPLSMAQEPADTLGVANGVSSEVNSGKDGQCNVTAEDVSILSCKFTTVLCEP